MPETMTAPAAPVTPVSAPVVPQSLSAVMSKVAQQTGIKAEPVVETPTVAIVRDPSPKPEPVLTPEGATPPVEVAPADTGAPAADPNIASPETGTEPANAPVGEIVVNDGAIKIRAERNADGTFKAKLDPTAKLDVEFSSVLDKETGKPKVYTKTIGELARLAQDGVTLQPVVQELKKLEPEVEFYRENAPKWEQHATSLQQELEHQMALNRELLLGTEELVVQRREEFAREMSPEKRLERLEKEREQERLRASQTRQQQELAQRAGAFVETRLGPVIGAAQETLGKELVIGKFNLDTQHWLVNGLYPPDSWPKLDAYVNGPFREWVAQESAKRTSAATAQNVERERLVAEQKRAQAAVNESGRTMVPTGRAGTDAPPPAAKPKNVADAVNRMVNRPLPQTVGASS